MSKRSYQIDSYKRDRAEEFAETRKRKQDRKQARRNKSNNKNAALAEAFGY